jgi:ABC-2 type transport system ATP-binding protein
MTEQRPIIETKDLTRRFRDLVAVEDLTFSVNRGELFGLVGPDGAGKTTTLRMLAGVLKPSNGDAILNGISVVQHPERVKHEIAYMSQRFGLYTDLTVLENLHFYADLYQVPKAHRADRIERLFQFSNLGSFKDRLAGKLSGGMKQKLGLSCALIHQPNILLLDEPTFGVDPISRRDLWLIVHDMVAQGMTAVISTAYMDEAERFDRIAILQQGHLLTMGKPETLQQGLEGEVIIVRVERVREARDLVAHIPGIRSVVVFGEQLHVVVPSAERDGPTVEAALREEGFSQIEWRVIVPTMEDVFIDHMIGKSSP